MGTGVQIPSLALRDRSQVRSTAADLRSAGVVLTPVRIRAVALTQTSTHHVPLRRTTHTVQVSDHGFSGRADPTLFRAILAVNLSGKSVIRRSLRTIFGGSGGTTVPSTSGYESSLSGVLGSSIG